MKRRAWIWTVLLVGWIAFIWAHSLIAGEQSDETSLAFVELLKSVFNFFGVTETSVQNHIIRKCAHFAEYFVLGLLARQTVVAWRDVRASSRDGAKLSAHMAGSSTSAPAAAPPLAAGVLAPFLLGFLVAAIDENIQLYVPGRSGMVTDVLLDSAGVLCAVLVAQLIPRRSKAA